MIKPSDLLHELEQGERIEEDVKEMLGRKYVYYSSPADMYITDSYTTLFAGPYTTSLYEAK